MSKVALLLDFVLSDVYLGIMVKRAKMSDAAETRISKVFAVLTGTLIFNEGPFAAT
jgi:hypothetical protein